MRILVTEVTAAGGENSACEMKKREEREGKKRHMAHTARDRQPVGAWGEQMVVVHRAEGNSKQAGARLRVKY